MKKEEERGGVEGGAVKESAAGSSRYIPATSPVKAPEARVTFTCVVLFSVVLSKRGKP